VRTSEVYNPETDNGQHCRYEGIDSTIAKTCHISFAQIRRQDPLAADYLAFMACIDRINVQQSLLPSGGSRVQQIKGLGTLTGYAFIIVRASANSAGGRKREVLRYAPPGLLSISYVCSGHEIKAEWEPYLSHAIHAAGCEDAVENAKRASLLSKVGQCQQSLGQYRSAEASHR
jgi:hypothetical protein